jgi:hypothetical protein
MDKSKALPGHLLLVKPTLETPFHISHDWWEQTGRDFRVELRAHLCAEHRSVYEEHFDTEVIDWVDERTGEVTPVDGLQHIIREHCSQQSEYLSDDVPLIDAVFRVLIANGNKPLMCSELAERSGKSAKRILRTLSGSRIYKGLRPAAEGS